MKTSSLLIAEVLGLLAGISAMAQGAFQNLDFEAGTPGSGAFIMNVPVANALPDWSAYYGVVQQSEVGYNIITTGATQISLIGGAQSPIDGNFSVLLQGGPSGASISQTATIPAGTQTLLFEAQGSGLLDVSIGNQNVPFSALGSGADYTLYGASISAWAGYTEPLTFSAAAGGPSGGVSLDDISFTPITVTPEPEPIVLITIGGGLFAAYRRFVKRGK